MEPARRIGELIAWQLGTQLRDLVYAVSREGRVLRDRKFCEQIRQSAASIPAILAEGFGRYYPRENASFVRIAKGSLTETQNHLQHGRAENYRKEEEFTRASRLSCRAMKATVRLLRYLESCKGKIPTKKSPDPPL